MALIFSGSRYRLFCARDRAQVGLLAEDVNRHQAVGVAGVVREDVARPLRPEVIGPRHLLAGSGDVGRLELLQPVGLVVASLEPAKLASATATASAEVIASETRPTRRSATRSSPDSDRHPSTPMSRPNQPLPAILRQTSDRSRSDMRRPSIGARTTIDHRRVVDDFTRRRGRNGTGPAWRYQSRDGHCRRDRRPCGNPLACLAIAVHNGEEPACANGSLDPRRNIERRSSGVS